MVEVTVRAVVRVVVGHVMLQPGDVARVRADVAAPILRDRPGALVLVEAESPHGEPEPPEDAPAPASAAASSPKANTGRKRGAKGNSDSTGVEL